MSNNKNLIITTSLLVSYAYGMLAPELSSRIMQALQKDDLLCLEYEAIVQLIKEQPDIDTEEILEEIELSVEKKMDNKLSVSKKTIVIPLWKKLSVAAVFIVLGGICVWLITKSGTITSEEFAQQIVQEKFENYPTVQSGRGEIDSMAIWLDNFKKTDYQQVVKVLEQKRNLTHAEEFFLGLSYLKTSPPQLQKAEQTLQAAANSGEEYKADALLYIGVAQTLQQKKAEAIQTLNQLPDDKRSAELLGLLRK